MKRAGAPYAQPASRALPKGTGLVRGDRLPPFSGAGGKGDQPAPGKTSTPRARGYSPSPVSDLLAVANLEDGLLREPASQLVAAAIDLKIDAMTNATDRLFFLIDEAPHSSATKSAKQLL